MRVLMVLNQIQAGVGTKDDVDFPLTATKIPVGPGTMMAPIMIEHDELLLATIYCGTGLFESDKTIILRKIVGMVKRLAADVVICGPSFDYVDFSKMSLEIAKEIKDKKAAKVVCAMSEEVNSLIDAYKQDFPIVKMPKKGGAGLKSALKNICKVIEQTGNNQEVDETLIY